MTDENLQMIAQKTPDEVLMYALNHDGEIEPGTDWHGLAEVASSHAYQMVRHSQSNAESWAKVAVFIYDRLAEKTVSPAEKNRFERDSMSVRANMIRHLGCRMGHPVLDGSVIEKWFFLRLDHSFEEASIEIKKLNSLPVEDFLRITILLERITILKSLQLNITFQHGEELSKWFSLAR
jgi:hypothetical protein